MVTDLDKRPPLTANQLAFLRPYILQKRRKEKATADSDHCDKKLGDGKDPGGSGNTPSDKSENTLHRSTDQTDKHGNKFKESDIESPINISEQIKTLQERLESLKKEKHSLFQQLKVVLHDEDEKKRVKEEEQKLELEKSMPTGDMYDPRAQSAVGLKRPYSSMLSSSYPGTSPIKRQQRGPLLPTPEVSSPGQFSRQSSGGSFHTPTESFHPSGKPLYSPRGGAVQRPPFVEQRLGHSYNLPPDMHLQGSHPPLDPPIMARGHQTPQSGAAFAQPHPSPHDLQPQYPGMQVGTFQYTPNPSPYGSMNNLHGPSGPSQPVPMQYPQSGSQVGFVQQHPHDIHQYTQPLPHHHDIGHPHYGTLAGQVMGSHPPAHGDPVPAGSAYPAPLHDPRHQKLVSDHQISGSGLKSPGSIQSPLYSS